MRHRPILKSLCANRFVFWCRRIQLSSLETWQKTAKSPPFCVVRSVMEPAPLLPHALHGELLTRSIHAKTFEKRSRLPEAFPASMGKWVSTVSAESHGKPRRTIGTVRLSVRQEFLAISRASLDATSTPSFPAGGNLFLRRRTMTEVSSPAITEFFFPTGCCFVSL